VEMGSRRHESVSRVFQVYLDSAAVHDYIGGVVFPALLTAALKYSSSMLHCKQSQRLSKEV